MTIQKTCNTKLMSDYNVMNKLWTGGDIYQLTFLLYTTVVSCFELKESFTFLGFFQVFRDHDNTAELHCRCIMSSYYFN